MEKLAPSLSWAALPGSNGRALALLPVDPGFARGRSSTHLSPAEWRKAAVSQNRAVSVSEEWTLALDAEWMEHWAFVRWANPINSTASPDPVGSPNPARGWKGAAGVVEQDPRVWPPPLPQPPQSLVSLFPWKHAAPSQTIKTVWRAGLFGQHTG